MEYNDFNTKLEQDDKTYIWHPFTQMQDYMREKPLIIESGSGNLLTDIDGNTYIDGVSSLWTTVHGHRKPEIDTAIRDQLNKIAHSTLLGASNIPAIQCAEKLVAITPEHLSKVFYSDSGSTAMEIAVKLAYQYQQQSANGNKNKKRFITFKNAYHGDTIGSVSIGGIDLFHKIYHPLLFDTITIESPYCYRCPYSQKPESCEMYCLQKIEDTTKQHARETAALIIEPLVQGAAGMITHPDGFLKKIRQLCTEHEILLIADEVAVGFGKTGTMFACEQEQVTPDIMAVAKGITGGYLPLAATITTEEIFNGFLGDHTEYKTFFHGHTYTGNPLACAAAVANIDIFTKEQTLEKLAPKIELLHNKLKDFEALPHVGDIRKQGVMIGIELVADKATKTGFAAEDRIGHKVIMHARNNGLLIRPLGDVIILMPPLSITEQEIEKMCAITYNAIQEVTGQ